MEQVSKPDMSKTPIQNKLYFRKCTLLCVYIFEHQIRILLFNKLNFYKVLIDYKNFQSGFSNGDAKCFEFQSRYWSTLEPSTLSLEEETCEIFLNPETYLKHLNLINTK